MSVKHSIHIIIYIMVSVAAVAVAPVSLVSCGNKEDKPKVYVPPTRTVAMTVPSGTAAPAVEPVDTIPGQTHVTVTCRCFGTTEVDGLASVPRYVETARRDTSLLRRINRGEVYVVEPGERGYILAKNDNRLQVRFPDKIVWVMVSDTK